MLKQKNNKKIKYDAAGAGKIRPKSIQILKVRRLVKKLLAPLNDKFISSIIRLYAQGEITFTEVILDSIFHKLLTKLTVAEAEKLRTILRISIGDGADDFSEEDLDDLAETLLEATAIVLKTKQVTKKIIKNQKHDETKAK